MFLYNPNVKYKYSSSDQQNFTILKRVITIRRLIMLIMYALGIIVIGKITDLYAFQ